MSLRERLDKFQIAILRSLLVRGGYGRGVTLKFGPYYALSMAGALLASKFSNPKGKAMYRQGDVLIVPVKTIPRTAVAVAREEGRVILAHGEVTGHAHAIKNGRAALFSDPRLAAIFMHVAGSDPVSLEHDEHDTIALPPGDYQIIRQREYSPEAIRNVAD